MTVNRVRFGWVAAAGIFALLQGVEVGRAQLTLTPGVDYTKPNYAYSPPLRKFVDGLPGFSAAGVNNLGQYISEAWPDRSSYPGSDYYEIAEIEYVEQLHSDLPPVVGTNKTDGVGGTRIRGYVQIEPPGAATIPAGSAHTPLTYPGGAPILFGGFQVYAYDNPHYLGPMIVSTTNVPTRLKFYNLLPLGLAGNLPAPVDTTLMGAGPGPKVTGTNLITGLPVYENYTQNRATIHLHGGNTPWVSDGTALQWITPAGETTSYTNGASQQNVPDMDAPPNGSATFYWSNQQSGRLMFYHDHAVGITRFVMTGVAAAYLLVDPAQEDALAAAGVPGTMGTHPDPAHHIMPLVIQDKTFVPDPVTLAAVDPLWLDAANTWQGRSPPGFGNFWFPHVYMPNQDPTSLSGANALGRWDYGPWFWPPWPVPAGSTPPQLSAVPEAFMDTPVVNGTAYPHWEVQPAKYRLRILNACNDRMLNLQLYVADPNGHAIDISGSSVPPGTGFGTEVAMIPAVTNPAIAFPPAWLTHTAGMLPDVLDARPGGVPNPALRGPAMIQIGTEGGVLPGPVVQWNTPVGYEQNKRNIVVLNVSTKTLFIAPAERADVIVDFSKFAGKTVILYNDAPAPVPASDPRNDLYTGAPDLSITGGGEYQGGSPSTLPGYGPNTRTILQFRVAAGPDSSAPPDDYDPVMLSALQNPAGGLPAIFKATQDMPVVPQHAYDAISYPGGAITNLLGDNFSRIQDTSLTFTPYGSSSPATQSMQSKAIQELFDMLGRMNATLGIELPFTNGRLQTTVPLGFTDPVTEIFNDGETQLWKITHNGVDSHGIHFHLFNVQVINRVGWDGAIRPADPNELGWKDTVRMNPLEDIIVAMRAKVPDVPFGCPESVRPLNPALPSGSTFGFANIDPLTGNAPAVPVSNVTSNFGWEYTWHCHILGHEENDMMRPMSVRYTSARPAAPVLSGSIVTGAVFLAWTEGTPANSPATMGNPANEIGFRVERAIVQAGVQGPYAAVAAIPANKTNYNEAAAGDFIRYRVVAFNVAGAVTSTPVLVTTLTPPVITLIALPTGEVAVAYNQTLAATGGTGSFTWSIAAGALPPGLSMSVAGVISGKPNAAGTYNFTVQVTDLNSLIATRALRIVVLAVPVITTAPLPPGEVTLAYSQPQTFTGGLAPYAWTVLVSGALPGGLAINPVTGVISGTPTASGTFNFTVRLTDANLVSSTRALSMAVAPALAITTASLPSGALVFVYNRALATSGGMAPLAWSIPAGALPPGLSINPGTGVIGGTPTAMGTFNFTAQAVDALGVVATRNLSIAVLSLLKVSTPALPNGEQTVVYNLALAASGGVLPLTWSVSAGALPGGLTMNAAGVISGTPTAAGTFNFTVQVRDAALVTATRALSIVVVVVPAIPAVTLPDGEVGAGFNQTLAATGGLLPLTWSVSAGALPGGLTLSSAGVIAGTPTVKGTFKFTVMLTDAAGKTATSALKITVVAPVAVSTTSLSAGKLTKAYSKTLGASAGTKPYTWSLASGALPPGIILTGSTGKLSGTPTTQGTFAFTVQVQDALGGVASQALAITIN